MQQKTGITLSALEEEVLTLLSSGRAYGLQIQDAIASLSLSQRQVMQGTLYPILKRLEQEQFVIAQWGDSFAGARRKYYEITKLGLTALQQKQDYRDRLRQWSNQ